MSILGKFLPNDANRKMFPGFLAFCIAGSGVVLGFIASAISANWLSVIAFIVTAIGVFGGFIFVLHGWGHFFNGESHQDKDKNSQ